MYDAFGNKYSTTMVQLYRMVMLELNTKLNRIASKNQDPSLLEERKRAMIGSSSWGSGPSTSGGVAIQ